MSGPMGECGFKTYPKGTFKRLLDVRERLRRG